jgi:DNA-binding response OmpR family regulator
MLNALDAARPLALVLGDWQRDLGLLNRAVARAVANVAPGAELVVTRDIASAIARLEGARVGAMRLPRLVIVSLALPEGSGLRLLEWARSQHWLDGVRLVAVSEQGSEEAGHLAHSAITRDLAFS